MLGKVLIHMVKNALRYLASLYLRQLFSVCVVPLFVFRNDPSFDLSFLIKALMMYADPEEHPED